MMMRFNKVELLHIACLPSHEFNKEGRLIFLEKQNSLFKRIEVCVERWCRLRGNLLFYFKNGHYCSDPIGVIVLENYTIVEHDSLLMQHSFTLVFNGNSQVVGAESYSEKATWMKVFQRASLNYLRSQMETLLQHIQIHQERCSVSIEKYRITTGSTIDLCKVPLVEMSVSCDNLRCDGNGLSPNPKVHVFVSTCPYKNWILYGQTEVMERTSNPNFLSTVTFRTSDGIDGDTRVCFVVSDVRERVTDATIHLGKTMVTVQDLMEAGKTRLFLLSPTKHTVGFITLNTWVLDANSHHATPMHRPVSYSPPQMFIHRRTQSLPPRLNRKVKYPSQGSLKLLYENPVVSTFRFHSGLGGDISAMEVMAEPFLCFKIPQQLLRLWIREEQLCQDEICGLGELSPEWSANQNLLLNQHSALISTYDMAIGALESHFQSGCFFKRSVDKEESSVEFAPVNLHLQRLFAQNESLRRSQFYDIITVGAFCASSLTFSNGGLLDMGERLKRMSAGVNKVSVCEDTVEEMSILRKQIKELLHALIVCMRKTDYTIIPSIIHNLQDKTNALLKTLDPLLIEEAFTFLDRVRIPSQPLIHPRDNYSDEDLSSSIIRGIFDQSEKPQEYNCYTMKLEEGLSEFCCYRSTDEPEPWDLIHLNVRASLICLSGKIANYCNNRANSTNGSKIVAPNDAENKECGKMCIPGDDTSPCEEDSGIVSEKMDCVSEGNLSLMDEEAKKVDLPLDEDEGRLNNSRNEETLLKHERVETWLSDIEPSMRKLGKALDGLMKTMRLAHTVFRLRQNAEQIEFSCLVKYRRDICFSQALTSAVTALLTKIWCRKNDSRFFSTLENIGPLLQFETLLSCYRSDGHRLSDMIVAVEDLKTVNFIMVPEGVFSKHPNDTTFNRKIPLPRITGSRKSLKVILPVPEQMLRKGGEPPSFKVTPVIFNIGINEEATLSAKLNKDSVQYKNNEENFHRLIHYFDSYKKHFAKDRGSDIERVNCLLKQLRTHIFQQKPKNVAVLRITSKICRLLGGLRFTSCKSAKDRTGMGVTLEQINILQEDFDLVETEFQSSLDCMRM